ncbi:MAG: hypothetical protein H6912_05500 [Kordiimonadaceae bacterium]|nr:hypothetical protein [Kordiimonadaceae bacterium]
MNIEFDESELTGFNDQAKDTLVDKTRLFATDLIEESNRLESNRNSSGGAPEITSSNVIHANIFLRELLSPKKKKISHKTLLISSSIAPLFVGLMYDKDKLQDGLYFIGFIIMIAVSILLTTVSIFKE